MIQSYTIESQRCIFQMMLHLYIDLHQLLNVESAITYYVNMH